MRTLKKNEQTLYYALYVRSHAVRAITDTGLEINDEGGVLLTDDEDYLEIGAPLTTEIDGIIYAVHDSDEEYYSDPVKFKANISFNSGDTQLAEYGLNPGDYNAIISATKGEFPFDEQTLIWHTSTPVFDEKTGRVRPESADYRVKAIKTSLNEERFILKKRVDD